MIRQLGQKYSVMTFDEELYCKADAAVAQVG